MGKSAFIFGWNRMVVDGMQISNPGSFIITCAGLVDLEQEDRIVFEAVLDKVEEVLSPGGIPSSGHPSMSGRSVRLWWYSLPVGRVMNE